MTDSTKGPWNYFVGNANGRGLIRIEVDGTGEHIASMPRGKKSEDRARLIAAAPELLEALQMIMDARWSPSGMTEENADRARAAIAKAEGK